MIESILGFVTSGFEGMYEATKMGIAGIGYCFYILFARDPCKKCLVKPICLTKCKKEVRYYRAVRYHGVFYSKFLSFAVVIAVLAVVLGFIQTIIF